MILDLLAYCTNAETAPGMEDFYPVKKENFLDGFLHKLIDEHLDRIALGILVIVSIVVRICLMPETELSPDYNSYYLPWVNEYRQYGIWQGLGKSIGDYYVPYNIMYALCSLLPTEPYIPITIFSTVAEMVSAYYISKIVRILLNEKNIPEGKAHTTSNFIGVSTLFLPFVVFNGALWKQCDAIYVVFLIISVYHLLKENYRIAFVFLAISFGFKLQAIFFIPLFLVVYMIKRKFSILEFFWIPIVYFLLGLPSVLAQKGLRATYLAYISQTRETDTEGYGMVSYYPNFYNFGLDDFDGLLKLPAVLLTVALLVIIAVFAYHNREYFREKSHVLEIGVIMAWTCTMFLPGMHERYDYAIVILFTAYVFAADKKLIPAALVMNICSLLVYIIVLFGQYDLSMVMISAMEIAAYFYTVYVFAGRVKKQGE